MNADALREYSREELRNRVQELSEQALKLRFQQSTGQIENPQMLRGVRRDIARAATILRERELGIQVAEVSTADAAAKEADGAPEQSGPQD